ncbi:unnamed protein product [Didymodactylos carnosus]|uniref:Uncharacterized protein n=1 Tax=Didymodactylos carnosus TaxID=1234261 RepID=A0A816AU10_9BILA|nr:unnamed protein product [Didymodactylos carnosus]CAF1600830.1 unnamed protein product [Didymodactylos carnosus]CAF4311852.1 unnamed protein product [Didymodactylos carnosus]CAF4477849.1 unnamed protein product [Didymodactylos carnosus]
MTKSNCRNCIIYKFPFDYIRPFAPHIDTLSNFAWKSIVIQDALKRHGSVIYGDASIRYKTNKFKSLLLDNLLRGVSIRESRIIYLPCQTSVSTFSWFNESYSTVSNVYMSDADFVMVTDNFLSRLIMKAWVTCALNSECIAPQTRITKCDDSFVAQQNIHRHDQSALTLILTYFFYQSNRNITRQERRFSKETNSTLNMTINENYPAPYDMQVSYRKEIATTDREDVETSYFTKKRKKRRSK